jgi:hypothetical protein
MLDMQGVVPRVGKVEWQQMSPFAVTGSSDGMEISFDSRLPPEEILRKYRSALGWRGWRPVQGWNEPVDGSKGSHEAVAVFGIESPKRPKPNEEDDDPQMILGLVLTLELYWKPDAERATTGVTLRLRQDDYYAKAGEFLAQQAANAVFSGNVLLGAAAYAALPALASW